MTSFDNAWSVAISPTMRATSPASSGASEITPWCERNFQGGRNSGRVVAKISSGACVPRSASACSTSSEVGSAQCRSSNASTSGWVRALASTHVESAASWRLRNSSGESFGARPEGSGTSITGASSGAYSAGSSPTEPSAASSSARRFSPATSAPPKRARPHSAIGCSGVFCSNCEDVHSTQVCGVSASRARNSSISRDLPRPGSPTISESCPSPRRARSQRRASRSSSSTRPTSGVGEREPPRRPPPLARTMR
jgi:hypothetical protein